MRELPPPLRQKDVAKGSQQQDRAPRPCAFLDRDGVVNIDKGYVYLAKDLELTATAAAGIRLFNEARWRVIVITNQSGVARGLFSNDDVVAFHEALSERLALESAFIDAFYHSPYHPDGCVPEFAITHEDRKPGSGMLRRALSDWPTDRTLSVMIGDRASDMQAAEAVGIRGILVPRDSVDLAAVATEVLMLEGRP